MSFILLALGLGAIAAVPSAAIVLARVVDRALFPPVPEVLPRPKLNPELESDRALLERCWALEVKRGDR